jgi:hypothetical protein
MKKPEHMVVKFNTKEYSILSLHPPYTEILLQTTSIDHQEYLKIVEIAQAYANDPRLVEMIRQAGDASAKVPYLVDEHETPDSILATLREIAAPHVHYLNSLPEKVQATIHTLLSINKLPVGYESFGIPALLEIDRIQGEMIAKLKESMRERKMAEEFYQANLTALKELDRDWPKLRQRKYPYWQKSAFIPEEAKMAYEGYFNNDQLTHILETCVIVDPPRSSDYKRFIPAVLRRPMHESTVVAATGSADWLIREVGKIGRHFTRALLEIIKGHLKAEKIDLDVKNYERINKAAHEILEEFIYRTP